MIVMTVSRFHVAQMDCGAEEQLVRMALANVDGIDRIDVDLDRRDVVIAHQTSSQAIGVALHRLDLGAEHVDDDSTIDDPVDTRRERTALVVAFAINAGFFVGELTVGLISGSMGLIADAVDMGADASVYALSLLAVGTAAARKQRLARSSGFLQFGLATIGLIEVIRRFGSQRDVPDATAMIAVSVLALAANVATLFVLRRVRTGEAHLEASWIFTANDVKVNLLVIGAALGVLAFDSNVPDLIAGGIIFVVVANGARRILRLSR